MKKFLSLVMALVMTMSLVTIGAGATEYKDFTDKSEVQYEEAVAVLNKIGIITGYEGGDFKPTGALTRGAAAKIIVSLMIGSEAAASLQVAAAPYKDVPVTNTFAAVISYCKTAGYINGYSDGTFRPTGALTGFAFAKMLLGALGYKGDIEGFSGSGWTMKVASVGSVAGLYDDFLTPFSGNAGVTREQACQLALNTLKATKVEYKGNDISVTGKDINVVVGTKDHSNVENKSNTDGNIRMTNVEKNGKDGLMQFAEQHFTDLKQLTDTTTDFGRPATRWAYKNVTIDEFAKVADFTFTAAPSGDTNKDKVKDMGLDGYKVYESTKVTINDNDQGTKYFNEKDLEDAVKLNDTEALAKKLVNLTGNGIVVEIYVDDNNADVISNIVVIRAQLMEVNTVSSKTITVKQLEDVGEISEKDDTGRDPVSNNKYFQTITSISDDDDAFADLKGSKSGDYMLITYTGNNATKDAYSAKAPQVVTGALTAITRNDSNKVNGVTVGGTAYKLAAIRDTDFADLNASSISSTKKDVTLYLDAYGYATYIEDAGTTDDFMVYGDSYQTLVNGKLVYTLTGWDMSGNEVSINVGSAEPKNDLYGDLIKYKTSGKTNTDYEVVAQGTDTNPILKPATNATKGYVAVDTADEIKTGASTVKATDGTLYRIASGVKTIFVDFDSDSTVKSVFVKNGLANVTQAELKMTSYNNKLNADAAQMLINKDGAVEAVVVKTTSSDAVSDKVLYIESVKGDSVVDGVRTYNYHVWVDGAEDDYTSTDNLSAGRFATYAEKADGTYKLSAVTKTDAATSAFKLTLTKANIDTANKSLIYGINGTDNTAGSPYGTATVSVFDMDGYDKYDSNADGTRDKFYIEAGSVLKTSGAQFADLKDKGFSSLKDVYDYLKAEDRTASDDEVELVIVMNNKTSADDYLRVSAVAVVAVK
ncbi:S-layer homology domain-containing protein [Oscillibacter sp.]|uniref:S-layer homology domain-containing protein n=1 Tax=Oscillibacter sp. TaxID=1945593 RepID=UPI0028A8DE52|nr:S-layer homology domain-containing protein [Oscillibacter sp.]